MFYFGNVIRINVGIENTDMRQFYEIVFVFFVPFLLLVMNCIFNTYHNKIIKNNTKQHKNWGKENTDWAAVKRPNEYKRNGRNDKEFLRAISFWRNMKAIHHQINHFVNVLDRWNSNLFYHVNEQFAIFSFFHFFLSVVSKYYYFELSESNFSSI